jgi:uncharacterized membrane protein YkvA (DUF1232 family)
MYTSFADDHRALICNSAIVFNDEGRGGNYSRAWEHFMKSPLSIKHYRNVLALLPQLPKVGRLCWRLWWDRRVPKSVKGMIISAMLYVLSPIDLVPGFLVPIFGQLDDVTVLMLAAYLFIRWSPPGVVAEHMAAVDRNFLGTLWPWLSRLTR